MTNEELKAADERQAALDALNNPASAELLPCPFCNKSDMLREMAECEDILVDCQRCEASAWKDIWQSRAQPKYKRVDLEAMRIEPQQQTHEASVYFCHIYNRAIDDIKSKHGDLYVEVKNG